MNAILENSDVISKMRGKWHEFKIIYDDKKKKINVFLNKELIFDNIKFLS